MLISYKHSHISETKSKVPPNIYNYVQLSDNKMSTKHTCYVLCEIDRKMTISVTLIC